MADYLSTRRLFLQRGLSLLAAAPTIPAFLDRTAWALADPLDAPRTQKPAGHDNPILVVIQLAGGNDGLNMVIPYGDDQYHRARPSLGQDVKSILKIDDYTGLHPELAPLKSLYDDGKMGIAQAVGYPNPNRSHFRSTDIWQSALPDRQVETSGWIGRYFDNTCSGEDPNVGVAIGDSLPLTMRGERVIPLTFERPDAYRYKGRDLPRYLQLNDISSNSAAAAQSPSTSASALDFLQRTAMDAQVSSDEILRITRAHQPAGQYPRGSFGDGLRTVAAMIGGGLATRVYYVKLGGFDTHVNEKGRHDQLMKQLAAGVSAFWKDLQSRGDADRVLMMTFSEFGRRVAENASGGTDHGTAAPMLLFGDAVQKGMIGKSPSLTDLDHGDLKYAIDFRSIYAGILQNWLATPSKPILGRQFDLAGVKKR